MEKEKTGKKITAVVIAAALIVVILLCLVRCQSGSGDGNPTENTTNTTGATTAATTEGAGSSEPGTEVTEPSETPTETTQPTTESTTPPTEATQPSTEESKPTEPKETEPKATEPKETEPKPTEHSHSYSSKVVAPTCKEGGYTVYTCSCGSSYTDNKTSATGHSWSAWVTTKEPTENATGTAERKCSVCGTKETKTLDKLPESHKHSYSSKVTTATCTANGVKTYSCSCGDSYTESIPATGHSYSVTSETAGTCSTAGSKTYTCSNCGDSYSEGTGKADHSWVHHHTDEVGHWGETKLVCHCGWSCTDSQAIAAGYPDKYTYYVIGHASQYTGDERNNHSYDEYGQWIVDTPAEDYDECSVCGTKK